MSIFPLLTFHQTLTSNLCNNLELVFINKESHPISLEFFFFFFTFFLSFELLDGDKNIVMMVYLIRIWYLWSHATIRVLFFCETSKKKMRHIGQIDVTFFVLCEPRCLMTITIIKIKLENTVNTKVVLSLEEYLKKKKQWFIQLSKWC